MACSLCGLEGHNSRTCPQLLSDVNTQNGDDYAIWFRYGGLKKEEAKDLKRKFEELVEEIAPDSYGVIAAGKEKKLPERIQQAIKGAQPSASHSLEDKSKDE
ncbi:Uncharacterised protein [BD1-7 clade bacterium]|nr:Uncharacterised protein [BD1-7 clade bacterium]